MQDVIAWIVAHQGELWTVVELALALATVVTGMTRSPRANGIVALVRAWVGRLSLVTHRDAPGTFKLPGRPADGPRS